MPQCLVCSLPEGKRETIDTMIRDAIPLQDIEDALAAFGSRISKASISRHKTNHLKIVKPDKVKVSELSEQFENLPPPAKIEYCNIGNFRAKAETSDLKETSILERRTSQLMLEHLVQNQLSIVATMQKSFMDNQTEYPRDQITGLKSLMELIAKLPNYSTSHYYASNELDETAKIKRDTNTHKRLIKNFVKRYGNENGTILKYATHFPPVVHDGREIQKEKRQVEKDILKSKVSRIECDLIRENGAEWIEKNHLPIVEKIKVLVSKPENLENGMEDLMEVLREYMDEPLSSGVEV